MNVFEGMDLWCVVLFTAHIVCPLLVAGPIPLHPETQLNAPAKKAVQRWIVRCGRLARQFLSLLVSVGPLGKMQKASRCQLAAKVQSVSTQLADYRTQRNHNM